MPDNVAHAFFFILVILCASSIVSGVWLILVAERIAETLTAIHAQLVSNGPRDASP